jgi:hypothetical protein
MSSTIPNPDEDLNSKDILTLESYAKTAIAIYNFKLATYIYTILANADGMCKSNLINYTKLAEYYIFEEGRLLIGRDFVKDTGIEVLRTYNIYKLENKALTAIEFYAYGTASYIYSILANKDGISKEKIAEYNSLVQDNIKKERVLLASRKFDTNPSAPKSIPDNLSTKEKSYLHNINAALLWGKYTLFYKELWFENKNDPLLIKLMDDILSNYKSGTSNELEVALKVLETDNTQLIDINKIMIFIPFFVFMGIGFIVSCYYAYKKNILNPFLYFGLYAIVCASLSIMIRELILSDKEQKEKHTKENNIHTNYAIGSGILFSISLLISIIFLAIQTNKKQSSK